MRIVFLIVFLGINFANSQNIQIPEIIPEYKENANTIKISDAKIVEYKSYNKLNVTKKYRVLVLNEIGYKNLDLYENYNKSNKVKALEVTVYNALGKKIKHFNKSEFKDQSISDGFSVFSDNRILYLDYLPITYPFVLEYESEIESVNTAFLNSWTPISNCNETILESKLEIINNPECIVNLKVQKLEEFKVVKTETSFSTAFLVKDILAVKPEAFADYSKEFPSVKMYLNKASLEGYDLDMSSWKEFGKMYYNYFIKDNSSISDVTKNKLDKIIFPSDSKLDKIKKVYKYVQDNTRYVSIQVGVGGWKPMEVSDVEKYGYGDCKALSNYTRAILKAYDIESFYTAIYGGEKQSFDETIVAKQSNHIILSVPFEEEYIFLECTSQTNPFGYLGDFTSNRNALLIKPDGGEVVNTNFYKTEDNTQKTKCKIHILNDGSVLGEAEIISKFMQYDNVSELENKNAKEISDYYKNHFSYLNNLEISKLQHINNREVYEFVENFNFKAQNYYEKGLNSIIFPLNVLNRSVAIPSKYRNKRFSFEIDYGFVDSDEIEIELPLNYSVTKLPEPITIKDKFGNYQAKIILQNNKLFYTRKLVVNDGLYENESYEAYRKFLEQVNKSDNIKILIEVK